MAGVFIIEMGHPHAEDHHSLTSVLVALHGGNDKSDRDPISSESRLMSSRSHMPIWSDVVANVEDLQRRVETRRGLLVLTIRRPSMPRLEQTIEWAIRSLWVISGHSGAGTGGASGG